MKLIVDSLAAFVHNRQARAAYDSPASSRLVGRDRWDRSARVRSNFYKVTNTNTLSHAVAGDEGAPAAAVPDTVVGRCVPPLEGLERYWGEGVRDLNNRRFVLQCMQMFMAHVWVSDSHWNTSIS
ncbi:hypothetical protein SCP_1000350 [Sparassis crispa]|uniref:Uncharacterized protein n=1 Tax=Sparassis crispa TaxID=139825 RepID=A0A401GX77_9APHY|nr:hypothetical protein SCP_1000350 [Sparassis crispa]GBE86793.1 hypothetical protein SCP_1000350 [Sparassis crispa]